MDRVCVIMSVYQSDPLDALIQSLDSMMCQTYLNLDIYLCQDGPVPFNIESVLNEYSKKYPNFHVIKNDINIGLARSLNKVIDFVLLKTDAKYFVRMDSDDISLPDRVEKQITYMKANRLQVCGSFCKEFGASYALPLKRVPIKHEDIVKRAVTNCPFIHPTVVFERKVFEEGLRYPEDTVYTEDMALWFLIIKSGYFMGNISEVLLEYRLTEDTVLRRLGWKKGYSEFSLRVKYMMENGELTLSNCLKVLARLPFHVLPVSLIKMLYKYAR